MKQERKYYSLLVGFLLLLSGCSGFQQLRFEKDKSLPLSLGQIVTKEGVLKNNIETKGIPKGLKKIQVSIVQKELKGARLERYRKTSNDSPSSNEKSSDNEMSFLEIEIIDDIGFAQEVNADQSLKTYVTQSKKAGVVTTIRATSGNTFFSLGSTWYLEIGEDSGYNLVNYEQDEITKEIPFSQLTVFEYQVSYFCYGLDDRNQIAVLDLVEEGKHCKRPLERNTKNLLSTKRLVDY